MPEKWPINVKAILAGLIVQGLAVAIFAGLVPAEGAVPHRTARHVPLDQPVRTNAYELDYALYGRFRTRAQLEALCRAARDYIPFAETETEVAHFTLRDEREARAVERLGRRVAPFEMKDMQREGRVFTVKDRPYDLGLLVTFVRYGRAVFGEG
ncbi:MAG: hypothetical protein K6U03_01765 [Firmicutes bacterium]|nr:hypothetical protein [Bacillota bacterium]